jgi:hypothetical protein
MRVDFSTTYSTMQNYKRKFRMQIFIDKIILQQESSPHWGLGG